MLPKKRTERKRRETNIHATIINNLFNSCSGLMSLNLSRHEFRLQRLIFRDDFLVFYEFTQGLYA